MRIVFQFSFIYRMAFKEGYIPIKGILFDLHGQNEKVPRWYENIYFKCNV